MVRVYTPNGVDGGAGDRLAIGDDGQGLQSSVGEALLVVHAQQPFDVGSGLGIGYHLHAAAIALDAHAALSTVGGQALHRLFHLPNLGAEDTRQHPHVHGPLGHEEEALQDGLELISRRWWQSGHVAAPERASGRGRRRP